MNRRGFVAGLGAALAAPLDNCGATGRDRIPGRYSHTVTEQAAPRAFAALVEGLQKLGYEEGEI
jgi:hypothetical protein